MIYYIEYSRERQELISLLSYPEADRALVQAHALKREIEESRLPGGLKLEIVMLEADSESTIRKTHSRYFGSQLDSDAFNFATAIPT